MAYDARVLQILIASPGDVREEREIISEVIYEWNYVYSRDRSVVLLPLRWETHASPEIGSTPQSIINRQVVDYCDMAIGVFWIRLGTPTGEAESGTAEEIARVGSAGKPVMLYFSQAKLSPETLDLEEYARLKEFKSKTYLKGLIESYSSLNNFREKLQRQLAIHIRDLIAESALEQGSSVVDARSIALSFAYGNPVTVLPSPCILSLAKVICVDEDKIPNYTKFETESTGSSYVASVTASPNPGYYRELVGFYQRNALRRELRLAVSSISDRSIRDIYMEIRVRASNGNISINPSDLAYPSSHGMTDYGVATLGSYSVVTAGSNFTFPNYVPTEGRLVINQTSADEWRIETNFPVVQAQRTVFSVNSFTLAATDDSQISFDATVYSSDAPPFPLAAELDMRLEPHEMSYREILKAMQVLTELQH